MSNVGLDKVDSVCIWMNWTQGHHVSKCSFSVRTHLATKSNFSYVPSGVFQLDFSNHEKQSFYICCKLSKSVVTLSLLKIYVFSPPGYELCLLQPEKLPTLAKKVPSSQFDINTAVEVGKFLVEAVDTLTCPLFEESRWFTKTAHLGLLQISPSNFPKFSIFFKQFQAPVTWFRVFVDVKCPASLQNPFKEALTVTNWWSRGRKGVDGGCSTCLL